MKMENTYMAPGTGEDSYARNSLIQAISISKVFPVVKDALEGLYSTRTPKCVMVAELGCASGPNALMMLPEVIEVTYKTYRFMNHKDVPEINMFLNDIPSNDFNTISTSLPFFHQELNKQREGDVGPYFISMNPGSYYKRLFPSDFLHFVHCANSAHWLSEVPKKLISESGEHINKGNIYIAETSPPEVLEAYREQSEENFTTFLKCRAQEIVTGGRMVLNIMASTKYHKPQDLFFPKVLNSALKDMANQGLVDEKMLDEFDMLIYPPTEEEVKSFVEREGSFHLNQIKFFSLDWDLPTQEYINDGNSKGGYTKINDDPDVLAKYVAGHIKSGTKSMLASHFGDDIMEELYSRATKLIAKQLSCGKLETYHHAISLIKK